MLRPLFKVLHRYCQLLIKLSTCCLYVYVYQVFIQAARLTAPLARYIMTHYADGTMHHAGAAIGAAMVPEVDLALHNDLVARYCSYTHATLVPY